MQLVSIVDEFASNARNQPPRISELPKVEDERSLLSLLIARHPQVALRVANVQSDIAYCRQAFENLEDENTRLRWARKLGLGKRIDDYVVDLARNHTEGDPTFALRVASDKLDSELFERATNVLISQDRAASVYSFIAIRYSTQIPRSKEHKCRESLKLREYCDQDIEDILVGVKREWASRSPHPPSYLAGKVKELREIVREQDPERGYKTAREYRLQADADYFFQGILEDSVVHAYHTARKKKDETNLHLARKKLSEEKNQTAFHVGMMFEDMDLINRTKNRVDPTEALKYIKSKKYISAAASNGIVLMSPSQQEFIKYVDDVLVPELSQKLSE